MSRLARIVVPDRPHHVTQRGNRREPIFFENGDQEIYRDLLAEQASKSGVDIWAYCLMPNHVHLIAVPGKILVICIVSPNSSRFSLLHGCSWVAGTSPAMTDLYKLNKL